MSRKGGNNEGSIRKRSNGLWEARVTVGRNFCGRQVQKSIYGKTRSEVSAKMNEILSQLNTDTYIPPSVMTVAEWMKNWLQTYAKTNLRPSSYASCEGHVFNHIIPHIGDIPLSKLTTENVQRFYNKEYSGGAGLSAKTVRNIHITLRRALQQAVDNKIISYNCCGSVILPKREKKEMRVLSREEQAAVMSVIPNERLGFAILFDLSTGLRIGELCGLKWSDFDLVNKTFNVKRTLQRVKLPEGQVTANGDTTMIVEGKVKTDNGYREIPIQDKVFAELMKYRERQDEEKDWAGCAYTDNDYVFASPIGGCVEPSTMRDMFNRLLCNAKVKHANFHSLRHTFATRAIEAGVPVKAVSEILGHASIQITLDLYCHTSIEMKRDAVNRMSDLW